MLSPQHVATSTEKLDNPDGLRTPALANMPVRSMLPGPDRSFSGQVTGASVPAKYRQVQPPAAGPHDRKRNQIMSFAFGPIALGFAAGCLSTLSPCVLPLLPIVVGSAAGAHRYGPASLATGLALSFTIIGVFAASVGLTLGLDGEVYRIAGGIVMLLLGMVLLSGWLQARFAIGMSGVGSRAGNLLATIGGGGLRGQFLVGILLGAVWSPCTGPTLGAASLLAAQQKALPQVALTMLMFGLGAAAPLLLVGTLSREMLQRWRGRLLGAGRGGRYAMGGLLVLVAALVLTGADKSVESIFVAHAPDWLIDVSGLV